MMINKITTFEMLLSSHFYSLNNLNNEKKYFLVLSNKYITEGLLEGKVTMVIIKLKIN